MTKTKKPITSNKPEDHVYRVFSLLRVGPRGLMLRFIDQIQRLRSGAPAWNLSRIRPFLYVGGQHRPKGWQLMEKEGITAILNMRESKHDDEAKGIGGIRHLHLPTTDNTPVALDDLHRAADFIQQEKELGGKVYVHCGVGVGRAPSAAAAYFIKYEHMNDKQAIKTLKENRPFVHLTTLQKVQLAKFAEEFEHERETQA